MKTVGAGRLFDVVSGREIRLCLLQDAGDFAASFRRRFGREIYRIRGGEGSANLERTGEEIGTCRPVFFLQEMVALKRPVCGDFRRPPQRARAVSGRRFFCNPIVPCTIYNFG